MFEEKGMILVPMVVEVFGRWGLRAEEMFAFVAKVCAARANERSPRADAFMRLWLCNDATQVYFSHTLTRKCRFWTNLYLLQIFSRFSCQGGATTERESS